MHKHMQAACRAICDVKPDGWQQSASALQCVEQQPESSFARCQARPAFTTGTFALPLTTTLAVFVSLSNLSAASRQRDESGTALYCWPLAPTFMP